MSAKTEEEDEEKVLIFFSSSSSLYINLLSAEQNAEILISEKKKTSVAE